MVRKSIVRLFQKSDIIRFLAIPLCFLAFALAVAGVLMLMNRKPHIKEISPAIANPGDVIKITGNHFGQSADDGWVEIADNRISGNAYLQWTDTVIMVTLPEAVSDGLVYVCGKNGRSNPVVFANRGNIPVTQAVKTQIGQPEIAGFDTVQTSIGKLLTIQGKNFGAAREDSEVRFSWQTSSAIPIATTQQKDSPSVACTEHDFDYVSWSDTAIKVHVPDGATTGNVFVRTAHGSSNQMPVTIQNDLGERQYTGRRTYLLALEVDVTDVSASDGSLLYVRIPIPQENASLHSVEITASSPKPYMENFQGTILHQIENLKTGRAEKLSHSILLTNYGVSTEINTELVKPYENTETSLYRAYTAADPIVPSTESAITDLAPQITQQERNPYLKAQMIYTWITTNITYRKNGDPNRSAIEALKSKTGDAYDCAVIFAALARASGIPAIPDAGILIDADRNSRVHWWAEFYVENFGWIPLDPGLAVETKNALKYFGSIEADHVAFSRGWKDQKPMAPQGRIVYKPRSFAFQPVWEESGGNIKSYTSFWGDPKVTGVY